MCDGRKKWKENEVKGSKRKEGRIRVDMRKEFFTVGVVKPWHRLPKEVVDAPSLQTSKVRLDGALSNLVQLRMSLLTGREGGLDGLQRSLPARTVL